MISKTLRKEVSRIIVGIRIKGETYHNFLSLNINTTLCSKRRAIFFIGVVCSETNLFPNFQVKHNFEFCGTYSLIPFSTEKKFLLKKYVCKTVCDVLLFKGYKYFNNNSFSPSPMPVASVPSIHATYSTIFTTCDNST